MFIGTLFIGLLLKFSLTHFKIIDLFIILILYIKSIKIGSLFPDIDHPKSYLGKRFPFISKKINSIFHHRGFTHSLLFIYSLILVFMLISIFLKIFYSYIYFYINIYIFSIEFGFILGCISHIFFDMFNPSGVSLLYPSTKKYRLPLAPSIRCNSNGEKTLATFLIFLTYSLFIIYSFLIIKFFIAF